MKTHPLILKWRKRARYLHSKKNTRSTIKGLTLENCAFELDLFERKRD